MKKQNNTSWLALPRQAGLLLMLVLLMSGQLLFAQSRQVTGVVKDPAGETIIGASVLEKGTTNGTITDFDGNFSLNVSSDKAVLVISYVGYKTQEISIAGKNSLIVTLPEDTETLEEVVVVGYGAQKKESVVGAISQVSSKELLSSPAANVSQAIAGKISGVITTQTSGAPGSDDTQINIRGRATFAGDGSPLILVDGVERSFSQIAPDDIESISVLKDASATAVYGVRGANGVMLITTKRGKEQKPEVNLTANWQIQSPTRKDTYLDSYQSVTLLEEALANDGLPSQFSANDIEMYRKSVAGFGRTHRQHQPAYRLCIQPDYLRRGRSQPDGTGILPQRRSVLDYHRTKPALPACRFRPGKEPPPQPLCHGECKRRLKCRSERPESVWNRELRLLRDI